MGTPEQVLEKIHRYINMGIRAFILSGYPLVDECKIFAEKVLPHIQTVSLPKAQGRIPDREPITPLTSGERK